MSPVWQTTYSDKVNMTEARLAHVFRWYVNQSICCHQKNQKVQHEHFSASEESWCRKKTKHASSQRSGWMCVWLLFSTLHHIRRSSLGSGRGRPGFSDPAVLVCFLSSALGLYVPSSLRFFLMTHSSSSRAKLSSDSTVLTNADSAGGINTCIAMVTDSWEKKCGQVSLSGGGQ